MKNFTLDDQALNELMTYMKQIMKGVRKAKKLIKLNAQIQNSKIPVSPKFWGDLISYAKSLGIDLIGFTEIDEYFIFKEEMIGYRIANKILDNAIVLGMEMKKDAIEQAPESAAGNEAMRVYAELGIVTNQLATYLQEQGYQAQPFHPFGGPVLYPPMAQKAGLGEIGYNGLLITKEFGPRLRLSMIATNATPLPRFPYSNFGIRTYCKTCGLCIKNCPTHAILPGDQKCISPNGKYIQNIDADKCFPQFFKTHGCSICIKVCPFSKVGYEKIMQKAIISEK